MLTHERFRDEPVTEFVSAFSFPFPGYAAFSLLGFADRDTEMLKEWSRTRVLLTYGRLSEDAQVATSLRAASRRALARANSA